MRRRAVDENQLSGREQRILTEIEKTVLRLDPRLDRKLRTFRMPWGMRCLRIQRRLVVIELLLLIPATVVLLRIAVSARNPAFSAAAAATASLTVMLALLFARSRFKRRTGTGTGGPGHPER
jgi:hypothetical protein